MKKGASFFIFVFIMILSFSFVLADVTYTTTGLEMGQFTGGSRTVGSQYDSCIGIPYQGFLDGKAGNPQVGCDWDGGTTITDTSNKGWGDCSYICRDTDVALTHYINVGTVNSIGKGVTEVTHIADPGSECVTFMSEVSRDGTSSGHGYYYCNYDEATGDLTAQCSTACTELRCGYVCIDDASSNSDLELTEVSTFGVDYSVNSGGESCFSPMRSTTPTNYGFGVGCNYNSGNGVIEHLLTSNWVSCSSICNPGSTCVPQTCAANGKECGNYVEPGCGTTLDCGTCTDQPTDVGAPYCSGNSVVHDETSYASSCNPSNTCDQTPTTITITDQDCSLTGEVCSGAVCVNVDENYWASFISGNALPDGAVIDRGDYVRLVSTVGNPYSVFRDQDTGDVIQSNIDEHYWKTVGPESDVNFSSGGGTGFSENLIHVNDDPDDTPMNITILSPLCGDVINRTQTVNVVINASDPDDIITGTVKINDNVVNNFDNLNGPMVSFNYQFNMPGNIQMVVDATNTRGEVFRAIKSLIVVDNTSLTKDYYVASCIDKPENFQRFNNPRIDFDARSSKGVIFHGNAAQRTTEVVDNTLLFYDWNFYHEGSSLGSCSGLGTESCQGSGGEGTVIQFTRGFSTVNDNYVTLTVSFPESLIS